jgi:hypothetical protein
MSIYHNNGRDVEKVISLCSIQKPFCGSRSMASFYIYFNELKGQKNHFYSETEPNIKSQRFKVF